MSRRPEVALIVSTYQQPAHLRRSLLSIGLQHDIDDRCEVIVADDGSVDETPQIVREFAGWAPMPVQFVTHPHRTHEVARTRNEGVHASTAPYLLFVDGDCILPRDHVAIHLRRRRHGWALASDCARMDQRTSEQIDDAAIRRGNFSNWVSADELARLKKRYRRDRYFVWVRHRLKPKLPGNNIAVWRSDFQGINGFDENFQGWGGEDDDLRIRLRRAGVRTRSIVCWTYTYHLWHASDVTKVGEVSPNLAYLERPDVPVRCHNGLLKHSAAAA